MTFDDEVWLAILTAALGLVAGIVGGAVSGDVVAKRAFRREQQTREAARSADWAFEPLGPATSMLRNIGDEPGLDVRLAWHQDGDGRLEQNPVDRIDPGDARRVTVAPFTQERRVGITWKRPDGAIKTTEREVPRSQPRTLGCD